MVSVQWYSIIKPCGREPQNPRLRRQGCRSTNCGGLISCCMKNALFCLAWFTESLPDSYSKRHICWSSQYFIYQIIDREAREIIRLVASVRPFVCLSVCAHMKYSPRPLCVYISNQGTFAIKELRAAVGGF